ncbi:MAG: cyclic nucleotide-binding domain-containing protein [bacterium]|nr:MAG: cyclic nucleotide-binding domain-containing protein [bacterium]
MSREALGKIYRDGEIVIRQGDRGDSLYVIQEGQVEILVEKEGREIVLRVLGPNELIGEMAIIEKEVRSATARAKGTARILTIDKKNFLKRISEDPTLAFRIIETMSRRIRDLSQQIAKLKTSHNLLFIV